MRRALLPVALLLLAGAAPALAQTVRGRLSGAGGEAVPGARVVLVSVDGRTVAATTTDAGGGFSLAAREAGLYRLRAERVGYAATWSAPFSLEAGQAVQHPLVANPQRVQLEGIRVEARARCEVRPAEGARTALVWEEARKALELASAATRAGLYRFDATRFERALDPYSLTVTREEVTTRADYAGTPYAAASVERLAEHGFVEKGRDRMVFYAPDADVLLSDAFLDTHCFRLAEHPDRAGGLIGLTFEPVPGRRVPDVEGVVWVDRATAELRSLDYRYTGLELREGDNLAAGRVEFLRLPSGSWIVSRWAIRMPVVESGSLAPGWRSLSDARRLTAIGVREEGGTVTAVRDSTGTPVALEAGARLAGVVTDSTTGRPLAGAQVYLVNTPHFAVTDAGGAYAIEGLPDGRYALSFASPRLDSLRWVPEPDTVEVARSAPTVRDLAIPPLARVLTAACAADSAAPAGSARLAGFVATDSAAQPLPGAEVVLEWTGEGGARRTLSAEADFRGVYRFCAAPPGVPLTLKVAAAGAAGSVSDLRLEAGRPAQQDLAVPRRVARASAYTDAADGKTHVLLKVVDAETRRPLSGAVVRLGSSAGRRTDSEGNLTLVNVRLGTYTVTVSHADRGDRTVEVDIDRVGGVQLELRVPPGQAVALAPIVATSRPMPRELAQALEERRRSGARRFIVTRDMMDRIATGAPHVETVLRAHVPGIHVEEVYYPGTKILWFIRIYYRRKRVDVYVDGRRASGEEVARLSPHVVQWMEFLPSQLANSRGYFNNLGGEAILLLYIMTPPPSVD